MIKLYQPYFDENEKRVVGDAIMSHEDDISTVIMGSTVFKFEQILKDYLQLGDDRDVSCVHSCTEAMKLVIQCHGIGEGDEVLVPTFTVPAPFQAVAACGANPIPCDVDLDDGFIDVNDAEQRITKNTKAILPILFGGIDRKIDKVYELAKKYNLIVIEDAAHSFGNENITKRPGDMCFSFDLIKNISTINGGAVVAKKETIERINDLRIFGTIGGTKQRAEHRTNFNIPCESDIKELGSRCHMSTIEALVGIEQMKKIDEITRIRRNLTKIYMEKLKNTPEVTIMPINVDTGVPHILCTYVHKDRAGLRAFMVEKDIETRIQYKPVHTFTFYNRGYSLPKSEQLFAHEMSFPLHPYLTEDDVVYVCDMINEFYGR